MAIISNGTTIASGGSLSVSANPPTTANAVGTYGLLGIKSGTLINGGNDSYPAKQTSGSNLLYANTGGGQTTQSQPSGTWQIFGRADDGNSSGVFRTTLWQRVS